MRNKCVLALILASTVFGWERGSLAQSVTWIGGPIGTFDEDFNWDTGMVPMTSDTVLFDFIFPVVNADFTVPNSTSSLTVTGSEVAFELAGQVYEIDGTVDLGASTGLPGSLTVLGGTMNVNLGNAPGLMHVGSTVGGSAFVVGFGADVTVNHSIEVGRTNSGNGDFLTVGDGGNLSISKNSLVGLSIGGSFGFDDAVGGVTVTGAGSLLESSSSIIVGSDTTGTLDITNGGAVDVLFNPSPAGGSSSTIIGFVPGSTGTVNVSSGSSFSNFQDLDVGRAGDGALNISGASTVTSGNGSVAASVGTTATVNIDGVNSAWNVTGDLAVGGFALLPVVGGTGSVDITNSGSLEVTGDIEVRTGSRITADGTIDAAGITIQNGATLSGTPAITANVANSGTVSPGFSPGIITIDGGFTQNADGLLEIEVEGLAPGVGHDQVVVTGAATLDGRLHVPVTGGPGFPTLNDQVTILTAATVTGQFHTITSSNLASQAPGLALQANYLPNAVQLQFVAPTINTFIGGADNNWFTASNWVGGVPTTANSVELRNTTAMDVTVNIAGERDASVYAVEITGNTNTMTLSIAGERTLYAGSNVEVGNLGIADLNTGGTIDTPCLHVNAGGLLRGTGAINGNTVVGSAPGAMPATLSPGAGAGGTSDPVGVLNQNGDLQVLSNGVVSIDVKNINNDENDFINIGGELTPGGTLSLDVTDYAAFVPDETALPRFRIATAESRTAGATFDDITVFDPNLRLDGLGIDIIYVEESVVPVVADGSNPEIAAATSGTLVHVEGMVSYLGDMNWDGQLDPEDDIPAFVLGLTDPDEYANTITDVYFNNGHSPQALGDVGGGVGDAPDGDFDFDDVDAFLALFPNPISAELMAMVEDALVAATLSGGPSSHQIAAGQADDPFACGIEIPEPTSIWLFLTGSTMLGVGRKRHRRPA